MTPDKIASREAMLFKCWNCPKMHNRVHKGKVQAYCNTCHASYMRAWRIKKAAKDASNGYAALFVKYGTHADV